MEEKIMYGYVFFKKYSTLPCSFIQTNKGKKNISTVKLLSEIMYITTSPDLIIGSLQHVVFKIISGKPNRIFLGHAI